LRKRLLARAQDDEQTIRARMDEAISEMSHYAEFDYIVVNDHFDTALAQMTQIVRGEGHAYALSAQMSALLPLIQDLLPSR
ncbi:MAG: guanylate kinase, partial [Proteobacteria bacterium]|nr:guanylate kinase [Pseudomonadota bacterium]